jgi:hypothetical protein
MRPVAQSPVVSSAHPTARSAALALGVFVYFVYSQSRDFEKYGPLGVSAFTITDHGHHRDFGMNSCSSVDPVASLLAASRITGHRPQPRYKMADHIDSKADLDQRKEQPIVGRKVFIGTLSAVSGDCDAKRDHIHVQGYKRWQRD